MKAAAKLLGTGMVLLLAQALLIAALPPVIRPDLILIFALAMGLRASSSYGLMLAFAFGFAVDALSGAPLGLFALLRGTACAATRMLDGALYLRAPAPWAVFVAGYAVADTLAMGLCLQWFAPDAALAWGTLAARIPGVALVTAIVAAPLLGLFRRLDPEPGREGAFGFVLPDIRL